MDKMEEYIRSLISMENSGLIAFFLLGVLALAGINRYANYRVIAYFTSYEMLNNNNYAFAVRRLGLMIGFGLSIGSALSYPTFTLETLMAGLGSLFLIGGMMLASFELSEYFLTPDKNNNIEIEEGSLNVALLEASMFISTGLIIAGSFSGEGSWESSIVFFILGNVVIVGLTPFYTKSITGRSGAVADNLGSSIMESAFILNMGLILNASISGDFISWGVDILSFTIWTIIGVAILFLFSNRVVDKIFIKEKELLSALNPATAIYVASIKIAITLLMVSVIL